MWTLSDGAEERVMQLVVSGRVACDSKKTEVAGVVVGTQNLAKSASRRTVHDMASCSWAITEPDPGADLKTDSDKMIREKPDDLKKYVVCKDAVDVCEGRDSSSVLLNGTAPPLKQGTIVESDAVSWSSTLPSLRVRLVIPNEFMGFGYYLGWVDFSSLTPLDASTGGPIPEPTVITYEMSRAIQTGWENGYQQKPIQEAIQAAIEAGKTKSQTIREACNDTWLLVRSPVLVSFGFAPGMEGLDRFMALPRDYEDDNLGDDDWKAIKDAHFRIVNLMMFKDPKLAQKADPKDRNAEGANALDEALAPAEPPAEATEEAVPISEPEPEEPEPPMTMERLEDIRQDCCANDVEIEAAMLGWTTAECEAFFESGGEDRPEGK